MSISDDNPELRTERGRQVWALKKLILATLVGQPFEVQMMALADAVAMTLATYQGQTPQQTDTMRSKFMQHHIEQVIGLIPINEDLLKRAQKRKPN